MKIQIRYDNRTTTVDVPEEQFSLMIQTDYEQRLATAKDPASVKPRSPQEIMDDRFNRPDYNNWHKHWRHIDDEFRPARLDRKAGYLARESDDGGDADTYTLDDIPDTAAEEARRQEERDRDVRAYIRKRLKPDYADMLISIHMDGLSVSEYAARNGESPNTVSHRLQRAEKKLKKIFEKRPF